MHSLAPADVTFLQSLPVRIAALRARNTIEKHRRRMIERLQRDGLITVRLDDCTSVFNVNLTELGRVHAHGPKERRA